MILSTNESFYLKGTVKGMGFKRNRTAERGYLCILASKECEEKKTLLMTVYWESMSDNLTLT